MARPRLFSQIYLNFVTVFLVVFAALTLLGLVTARGVFEREVRGHLEALALAAAPQSAAALGASPEQAAQIAARIALPKDVRITLVAPDGHVVHDSGTDPLTMDNHSTRPEVQSALAGQPMTLQRHSRTVGEDLLYSAAPVQLDGSVIGVLRLARRPADVMAPLGEFRSLWLGSVLVIGIIAAAVGFFISRRLQEPIETINAAAQRFAAGELDRKIGLMRHSEMARLADSLNRMASQMHERVEALTTQSNHLEAMLSSMIEGVIAVDLEERVLGLNLAAARLLGVTVQEARGRSIQEALRNTELQRFIQRALGSREPVEGEITLYEEQERILQAHGTVLRGAQAGTGIGALIVLHDVTRLKRLETMRRDFVANVSHELKTPITSIKGFAETLLGGAADNPEERRRFLEIVHRQADRLEAIINDLLSLSRIEQEAERGGIEMDRVPLESVISEAVQSCEYKAGERRIALKGSCPEGLLIRASHDLLSQAVANLIDNAVKYSEPGTSVWVTVEARPDEAVIRVRDQGPGIARDHLNRLFERFYRVDKSRSRKVGGTGLGLAIVKHIAQAHGGSVAVDSIPGQGSTFIIRLPRRPLPVE